MARKVLSYKVITGQAPSTLSEEVMWYLERGYELLGDTKIIQGWACGGMDHDTKYAQTVVEYEDE